MKDGFSEYESHIDNLIAQYKTQLEKIKLNRENIENSVIKTPTKNSSLQDNHSFKYEFAPNNITKIKINKPINSPSSKNDSIDYFNEEESFKSKNKIGYDKEYKQPSIKVCKENEKKYEILNQKEQVNKINLNNSLNPEDSELSKKISILNEENLILKRRINEMTKQNEKLNDLMLRNERIQSELNTLIESESKFKKELADSNAKCQALEQQRSKIFAEIELKHSEENSKIKSNIKEMENFYECEIKNKNHQIFELSQKLNDYENEINSQKANIDKLNSFLKNIYRFVKDEINVNVNETRNEKYTFSENELEAFFTAIDKYMNKLKNDNTELVKYINTKLYRDSKEEQEFSMRINKLNEMVNDLKIENSLLKVQINILDEQNQKKEKNIINREKSDIDKSTEHRNLSRKKKVSFESFDKNCNSYNPSRAITPIKLLGTKNQKSKKSKYVEDGHSNYDSEVSSTREVYKVNKGKVTEFPQNEKLNPIDHESNKRIYTPHNHNITSLYTEKEYQSKLYSPKIERIIKREVNSNDYSQNNPDDFINMKSPKALKETGELKFSKDLNQLEGLKMRIKDLENKLVEINKDDKEKQIIDSIREFRNKNISSPDNKNFIK